MPARPYIFPCGISRSAERRTEYGWRPDRGLSNRVSDVGVSNKPDVVDTGKNLWTSQTILGLVKEEVHYADSRFRVV